MSLSLHRHSAHMCSVGRCGMALTPSALPRRQFFAGAPLVGAASSMVGCTGRLRPMPSSNSRATTYWAASDWQNHCRCHSPPPLVFVQLPGLYWLQAGCALVSTVQSKSQLRPACLRVRTVAAAAQQDDYRQRANKDVRVLVVGATGYIGKFVVRELVNRGYNVVAFARDRSGIGSKQSADDVCKEFPNAGLPLPSFPPSKL